MKGKYLKRIGGFVLAALMLSGVAFVSSSTVQAQGRRGVIVRSNPYRTYRPFVFRDGESAVSQGDKDGFKTGKDDGKKSKSFNPERSHCYHDAGFGNYAEVYRSGFSKG